MTRKHQRLLTALTDERNVSLVVVEDGDEPRKNIDRAAEVLGIVPGASHPACKAVTARVNRQPGRRCDSEECPVEHRYIHYGEQYARVIRDDDTLEMFHVPCFQNEFGEAPDGGRDR